MDQIIQMVIMSIRQNFGEMIQTIKAIEMM